MPVMIKEVGLQMKVLKIVVSPAVEFEEGSSEDRRRNVP
jgi:hypothetical protein